MLCTFALPTFAQTTAYSVQWQVAGTDAPYPVSTVMNPAPRLYDGNVGDTGTGYSAGSVFVLWDMGGSVSISGFQTQFTGADYKQLAFYSTDGTNWIALSNPVSGSKQTFSPVTARYVQFLLLGNSSVTVTDTRLYDGSGALILGPGQMLPPVAPTGLTATGGGGQVTLTWNPVPGAASYNVYRGTTSGSETLLISGITQTSFTDISASPGTMYFYTVTAVNAAGESPPAGETSVQAATVPAGYVWTKTDVHGNITSQSPVYSGGSGATDNVGNPVPFALNGTTYGGTGFLQATYPPTVQTLDLVGPLTATFTWYNGGDPTAVPPPSVIITQTSTVSYNVNSGQGYLNNGMGASGTFDPYTYSLSGVLYTEKDNPGRSFPVTTPNILEAKPTTDGTDGCGGLNASVAWSVSVSPVTLILNGTTPAPPRRGPQLPPYILIGQGCTSQWGGIPNITNANYAYNWTAPTGTTFQVWSPKTPPLPPPPATPTTPANPGASYFVGGPGPLTNPTAHWYWNDLSNTQEKVSGSVTVTPPAGQGAAFTISATKPVSVEVPTWTASNIVGVGYIGTDPQSVLGIFAGPTLGMISQNYDAGSNWKGYVGISSDFADTGTWQYAQIVSPGEYETPERGTQEQSTETGLTGLDDVFPYGTPHDTGGSFVVDGDSPNFPVFDTYSHVSLDDAFATYLMFQPPVAPTAPAGDVQWVPLAESSWNTNFSALRPGTKHWADFPAGTSVGSVGLIHDFQRTTTHPTWTVRIDNSTVFP